jgi:putative nucleotidyltransferase with HDIG domain
LVNSAFFRASRHIARIGEAVAYLGFGTLKQLVLAEEVFSSAHMTPFHEDLRAHSVQVATLASRLCVTRAEMEGAFVAGLLHDVGKLVLFTLAPEVMEDATAQATATQCQLHVAECQLSGATHAELGAYLLGLWGLPSTVVEAVANHHAPWRSRAVTIDLSGATYLANALLKELRAGAPRDSSGALFIDDDYLRQVRVNAAKLEQLRDLAREVAKGGSV